MSMKAVNWALSRRVGNGKLKATLVAIACVCDHADSAKRQAVVREANLSDDTVLRHLKLLKFLNFLDFDRSNITLRISQ